ncbi:MAG: hypothetical protein L0027_15715, partial [Candidatus Rokubacteria bacterium]|nr:hypothetical protein [Candidatus Rokubacteria bacterium]
MRARHGSGLGLGQKIGLGAAGISILALTFTLGVLVGRQWARPATLPPSAGPVAAPEPARRTASPPPAVRRPNAADVVTVTSDLTPPHLPETLTFYQTLTAPLGPAPATPGARPARSNASPAAPGSPPAPGRAPAPGG